MNKQKKEELREKVIQESQWLRFLNFLSKCFAVWASYGTALYSLLILVLPQLYLVNDNGAYHKNLPLMLEHAFVFFAPPALLFIVLRLLLIALTAKRIKELQENEVNGIENPEKNEIKTND